MRNISNPTFDRQKALVKKESDFQAILITMMQQEEEFRSIHVKHI